MKVEWSAEKKAEAHSLRSLWKNRNSLVAEELNRRWGTDLTGDQVYQALRDYSWSNVDQLSDPLEKTQECEPVPVEVAGVAPLLIEHDPGVSGRVDPASHNPEPSRTQTIAPAVHTSKSKGESYLIIPDTQDPYSPPKWWEWAAEVARDADVDIRTPGRVLHTGDESDNYHASRFPKNPDFPHTPKQEIQEYKDRVKEIGAVFPHVWHARSNHGDRWRKKATECGFPEQLFRVWGEVIGAPAGWRWERHYVIEGSREKFILEHGDWGAQGINGTRTRVLDNSMSTVHGHDHSKAQIVWVRTALRRLQWGMNAACLVDAEAMCFDYGKPSRLQQTTGIGLVLDGGRKPDWIPWRG